MEYKRHKKKLVKFAHVLDISEQTSKKTYLDFARVYVGCENLATIPRQFFAVMEDQLCSIKIEVTCKFDMIENTSPEKNLPIKFDTALSVEEGGTPTVDKISASNRPSYGVTLHPAEARRSYTWRRIDLHHGTNGQKEPDKHRLSTNAERRQAVRKASNFELGASASME